MKNFLKMQVVRARQIDNGSQLYFIYFRLNQVITMIFSVYAFLAFSSLKYEAAVTVPDLFLPTMGWSMIVIPIVTALFGVALCELGIRSLDRGKSLGLYLGLVLSFVGLFGWQLPFGLFGFYAFLNPAAQRKYLVDAPSWFRDVLSFCRVNHIPKEG